MVGVAEQARGSYLQFGQVSQQISNDDPRSQVSEQGQACEVETFDVLKAC